MKNIDNKKLAKNLYFNNKVILADQNGGKYKIEVAQDETPENPRNWDNVCHIISLRGNWDIGDKGLSFDRDEGLQKLGELSKLEERGEIAMKPVYMYDHSGQTISLSDFGDRWDSGICGYIYVSKEEAFKKYGGITEENWKEVAYEHMEGEIGVYDQYIKGEVYGFQTYEMHTVQHKDMNTDAVWFTHEWEEIDSCWGFYGTEFETNGLVEYAIESIPDDVEFSEE